jgi:hypothetical protein
VRALPAPLGVPLALPVSQQEQPCGPSVHHPNERTGPGTVT